VNLWRNHEIRRGKGEMSPEEFAARDRIGEIQAKYDLLKALALPASIVLGLIVWALAALFGRLG
jgi:hypothetical protein